MSLERRIQKAVVQIKPFRDLGCMQKTLADRAVHAKMVKWFLGYVKDFNHEQKFAELEKMEQLLNQ